MLLPARCPPRIPASPACVQFIERPMATTVSPSPSQAIIRLRERLAQARARTDELFQLVRPEAIYDRPIPERHRIIFYVGHLEAFDWNLIGAHVLARPALDPVLDRRFAFGIDPVGSELPSDEPQDWPGLDEVRRYVERARSRLDSILLDPGFADAVDPRLGAGTLLNVALEHRLMHAETLTYMLHQLSPSAKVVGPVAVPPAGSAPDPRAIDVPAGAITLGRRRTSPGFGWDNEFEAHAVEVPRFAIDATKVSTAAYLRFVEAQGYHLREHWTAEDWTWIQDRGLTHPNFWFRAGNQWMQRTMFGAIPLPLSWPVYVSHAEASAYAHWAGKRLPTEAEWQRAAHGTAAGDERAYPWGDDLPTSAHGNFDFQRWEPAPVNAYPAGASAFGAWDLLGNGWEWTSTPFAPFPGFTPFTFYPGYSADFFDGRHFVLKGASARTAACMLRRSFRNWYQAHYGYVYAGFRCVQD
jgi:iron(II)-dependent oxidoreductase